MNWSWKVRFLSHKKRKAATFTPLLMPRRQQGRVVLQLIYLRKVVFFCDQSSGEIHLVSTMILDKNVRKCAIELQDTVLSAKLAAVDMISQDAVYHRACLVGWADCLHERYTYRHISCRFNNTRLKTRILPHLQDLQAYREGRDVLAFRKAVGAALRQAYERDFDDEAWILLDGICLVQSRKFHNSFENNCQQESTP